MHACMPMLMHLYCQVDSVIQHKHINLLQIMNFAVVEEASANLVFLCLFFCGSRGADARTHARTHNRTHTRRTAVGINSMAPWWWSPDFHLIRRDIKSALMRLRRHLWKHSKSILGFCNSTGALPIFHLPFQSSFPGRLTPPPPFRILINPWQVPEQTGVKRRCSGWNPTCGW